MGKSHSPCPIKLEEQHTHTHTYTHTHSLTLWVQLDEKSMIRKTNEKPRWFPHKSCREQLHHHSSCSLSPVICSALRAEKMEGSCWPNPSHRPTAELESTGLIWTSLLPALPFPTNKLLPETWEPSSVSIPLIEDPPKPANVLRRFDERDSFQLDIFHLILYHYGSVAWKKWQIVLLSLNVFTFLKRNYRISLSISVMMGENWDPKKQHRVIHKTKTLAVMIPCFSYRPHCKDQSFFSITSLFWVTELVAHQLSWIGSQALLTFIGVLNIKCLCLLTQEA